MQRVSPLAEAATEMPERGHDAHQQRGFDSAVKDPRRGQLRRNLSLPLRTAGDGRARLVMSTKYVPFPVPEHRIPEVAVFLYGPDGAVPPGLEAHEAAAGPAMPMSDEQREEQLTRIYVESEPPFAQREDPAAPLLHADILASHPAWEAPRSVAGGLGAFARRTVHRYGGFWPFERGWDNEQRSHFLTMAADVAAWLREPHDDRGMPLTR
jgi:hypothetical protein